MLKAFATVSRIALALERLDFAQARCHRQAGLDADADFGLAGAEPARLREREAHEVLQVLLGVAELRRSDGIRHDGDCIGCRL
jgi:hypothetical protein